MSSSLQTRSSSSAETARGDVSLGAEPLPAAGITAHRALGILRVHTRGRQLETSPLHESPAAPRVTVHHFSLHKLPVLLPAEAFLLLAGLVSARSPHCSWGLLATSPAQALPWAWTPQVVCSEGCSGERSAAPPGRSGGQALPTLTPAHSSRGSSSASQSQAPPCPQISLGWEMLLSTACFGQGQVPG